MSKTFVPAQHRPTLPTSTEHYEYKEVAWSVYWQMVHKTATKHGVSLWEAHKKLQKDHPFQVPDMGEEDYKWSPDDFLLLFLWQFEKWQTKKYDRDNLYGVDRRVLQALHDHIDYIDAQTQIEDAFALFADDMRDDIVSQLWCRKHQHLLEALVDDPIFGHNAKFEIYSLEQSKQYAIDELFRRAALPDNIIKIDKLIAKSNQSNYNVYYPYIAPRFHSVPNCLCVMADGAPIFRLEVLDPDTCTQFRLAELMDPWWGSPRLFEKPGPGEGEYDFPFYDFDICEDDVFDINKLLEVIERGMSQINSRHERRKWGRAE